MKFLFHSRAGRQVDSFQLKSPMRHRQWPYPAALTGARLEYHFNVLICRHLSNENCLLRLQGLVQNHGGSFAASPTVARAKKQQNT
jgi:hypothetical protein